MQNLFVLLEAIIPHLSTKEEVPCEFCKNYATRTAPVATGPDDYDMVPVCVFCYHDIMSREGSAVEDTN